jgi:D-alanyl-D-alanine carboxypeptidase
LVVLAVLATSPLASTAAPAHPEHTKGHGASHARLALHGVKKSDKAHAKDKNHPKDKGHTKDKSHAKDERHGRPHRVVHGPNYNPPYADIVVDANSGEVLHATDPDSPRHPASLTKIMTLYLLFEQLDAKKLGLGSRLPTSAFAASQTPTKLGLKPNDTITVEDAIKGLVTRSANDAAVVIAEALGGTETDFAALMTNKAQALGMANTVYVNASGLPADAQLTTARDQALLGRAIQDRFPEYYRYFSLLSFVWHRKPINNHNALLWEVPGVDGIKTGYTEASGYNLVCSLRREGRHLIAVVLGGRSNATRNARMRELLDEHLRLAAPARTAPPIANVAPPTWVAPAATAALPPGMPVEGLSVKPAMPLPSPASLGNVP